MVMLVLMDPEGSATVTLSWEELGSSTLSTVAHEAPSPLVVSNQGVNAGAGTSSCKVSGMVHGRTYQLLARATLSNGDVVPKVATIRAFRG